MAMALAKVNAMQSGKLHADRKCCLYKTVGLFLCFLNTPPHPSGQGFKDKAVTGGIFWVSYLMKSKYFKFILIVKVNIKERIIVRYFFVLQLIFFTISLRQSL